MTQPLRTRYAPSPTGALHVGGARAALFNYLFARAKGGAFIVRMEDTDKARSKNEYEKDILKNLQWLGIESDEDSEKGGSYGPYRQSERTGLYQHYLEKLLKERHAYYCFHSPRELAEEKEQLLAAKHPPLHFCEYRTVDPEEADLLKEAKNDYLIRFKTPSGEKIRFRDLIHGEMVFDSDLLGDFSIAKRLDAPLFNFAVVVDDYEMQISHVIRGEDHISNTPKHLLLIEALGFTTPQHGHLPLILGPNRSRLSKRHGATGVGEYRKAGYLPEALFNFLALLGWNPGSDREIFSKEELLRAFSLEKIQKSGAVFDIKKLDWMNGEYIRHKSIPELVKLCMPYLEEAGLARNESSTGKKGIVRVKSKISLGKIISLEQPRLKKLSEIGERTDYFFRQPRYEGELLRWKGMSGMQILAALERCEEIIKQAHARHPKSKTEWEKIFFEAIGDGDKGRLLWPLRVALTGKKASPGPFEIMEILGEKETLKRIAFAKKKLKDARIT